LIADWTNKNDVIAQELAKYGRAGVPLYLVYDQHKKRDLMTLIKTMLSMAAISALAITAPATAKIATGSNVSDMTVTDSNGKTHNLSERAR